MQETQGIQNFFEKNYNSPPWYWKTLVKFSCPKAWTRLALYRGFWPKPWTSVKACPYHPYAFVGRAQNKKWNEHCWRELSRTEKQNHSSQFFFFKPNGSLVTPSMCVKKKSHSGHPWANSNMAQWYKSRAVGLRPLRSWWLKR